MLYRTRKARRRRGYTVFEFSVTVILLLAASMMTAKVITTVGAERRAADRRLWAGETLSNVMERLATSPYDSIDDAGAAAMLNQIAKNQNLPEAEWSGKVESQADSKRLSLSVRWKGRSGEWNAPIRLTSWVYPERGKS